MSHPWSIARKELRSYFSSAVALIFLGVFLGVTVFSFFWVEKFFARGLADVRPMFEWFPILLILLVSALTMRLWSEEQKTGTIEILLTLPIRPRDLVLGKFLAGFFLIAMALALTLPIPISVAMMGNLDWGPVYGGYLAALLLASTYLSIGLCVSSATDNQILALFGTGLACALLYVIGSDAVVAGRSLETAEILRSLGTGSRFESIARGVLDLRDLGYYLSFVFFFLSLNILLVRSKRWSKGPRAHGKRVSSQLGLLLVFANVLSFNIWLAPVSQGRIDLTEDRVYSLSPATKELLASLDEPLLIRAYVSDKVHPLVDPLIPELFDLLREYEEASKGKLILEFVDPDADEELQKEADESYEIRADQFEITTRNKKALVNAYFKVLIEYGDQHEVLGFSELLHILPVGVGDVEVKLGNVEYEITKAIRKTMQGFQSLDGVFASLGEPVTLTAYTSENLRPELQAGLGEIESVAAEFVDKSGGQMSFKKATPRTQKEQEELARTYGLQPFAVLRSGPEGMHVESFYYHLVLQVGERAVLINPPEELTKEKLREVIESALRQAMPGFIKTVGVVSPPAPPMQNAQLMMQMGRKPPPPPQSFQVLRDKLSESYQVRDVSLSNAVPNDVDVLILAGPDKLGEKELLAVDQFLMHGGAVIALVGNQRLDLQRPGLMTTPVDSGLKDLFKSYGVELGDDVVFDENAGLFATVDMRLQRLKPIEAPYLVEVPRKGLGKHLVTSNLAGLSVLHASPLRLVDPKGAKSESYHADVLARSSKGSWVGGAADMQGSATKPAKLSDDKSGSQILAVAVSGSLPSYFAKDDDKGDKEKDKKQEGDKKEPGAEGDGAARLLRQSPPDARLVVISSSSSFADTPLKLMEQLSHAGGSSLFQNNMRLLLNLIDWSVEDTELLGIRARFAGARILEVDEGAQGWWEKLNYLIALGFVLGLFGFTMFRRRTLNAMVLDAPSTTKPQESRS